MAGFVKETPAGQFLRTLGFRSDFLLYAEEKVGFEPRDPPIIRESAPSPVESDLEKELSKLSTTVRASEKDVTLPASDEEAIVVSWTENDPENPRNWSQSKKTWTLVVVNLYTFCVYCTASIITPTAGAIQQRYDVSIVVASLGLSMYVVGYGLGPMFFSPISEIPRIGRNPPYLYSFAAFFVVSIALALVDSFPAIIVLRWLQGLFGSPALASGAASIEDIYDIYSAPYGYVWWIAAMYCGPAVGPLMAGYAVPHDWRWPLYEVIIMSGIILFLLPFLPETYPGTILLNRAKRLRKATGDNRYRAESELHPIPFRTLLWEALVRPLEITIKDPAVLYAALYGGLVYATYYSFFEAFPLAGRTGRVAAPGDDWRLGPPVGLLVFAWTARADIHWIAPTIGINIWAGGSFCMFQSIICYIALAYPKYVASLFAANDFARSMLAAGFVQFSRSMYVDLGIGKGVTVIAGLSGVGIAGMYGLYYFGAFLRAKKF
ncbi:hypothetical protein CLAIMM_08412 [Cladophialophora immunda]|nr:hypothetical protein CLAIMM_08412 [Cladophialophora immunda]